MHDHRRPLINGVQSQNLDVQGHTCDFGGTVKFNRRLISEEMTDEHCIQEPDQYHRGEQSFAYAQCCCARAALAANLKEPGRMEALRTMIGLSKADTASIVTQNRVPAMVVMVCRSLVVAFVISV